MDKGWTSLPRHTEGYQHGVNSFLDFAFSKGRPQGQEILCPCSICNNFSWGRRDEVYDHLISKGFQKSYTVWVHHGERISRMDSETDESEVHEGLVDDIHGLLNETFRHVLEGDKDGDGPNEDAKKFYNLLEEGKQELYPGCKKFLTLSFVIRLYLLKTLNGWSNASFTALLELLKEAIPHLNIPDSFNKIKAMVKDLGLGYNKIHACPNDCVLFRDTYEDEEFCPICGASRYIENVEVDIEVDKLKKKPVPAKVLRHFPLIPRLKKLFMCSKIAESLRWHDEHRSKDGKLRHPADGQSWKDFDRLHPDFAEESRNIRLGLASDGFNPFRTMSISHSTWPVVLVAYNLPPWCCMKPEYVMMSLLIPGPCSPGKSIDVYLQPLIEELKVLWEVGVETYDASKNKTFQLHAALLWTISDFPAYVMLSGWSTKGKLACPCCNYDTSSCYLKHSRKMCYMDHRIFLGMDHPYRMDKRSFNGNVELRSSPALLDGEQIFEDLKDLVVPLIFLVNELRLGGPVQFRWMYPIERYLCRLKSYVRNKSRPEGSIAEGYLAEECLTFCSREYEEHVNNQTKGRKWKKAKTLSHDFSEWFKERASHEDVPKQLKDLSRGPNTVAKRFSSYVINGYKF
ncbi:uncharacterized protein LOC110269510 [Arachis ipaensis]|uniref:uncharacterized protein LOC110269510 n=1 Tax=Arachis ipaensis TaxID=130454 RepID=UPI000A2B1013|nr:uncharacterized protein LOC110269510 [Arachis ipaensis]